MTPSSTVLPRRPGPVRTPASFPQPSIPILIIESITSKPSKFHFDHRSFGTRENDPTLLAKSDPRHRYVLVLGLTISGVCHTAINSCADRFRPPARWVNPWRLTAGPGGLSGCWAAAFGRRAGDRLPSPEGVAMITFWEAGAEGTEPGARRSADLMSGDGAAILASGNP